MLGNFVSIITFAGSHPLQCLADTKIVLALERNKKIVKAKCISKILSLHIIGFQEKMFYEMSCPITSE